MPLECRLNWMQALGQTSPHCRQPIQRDRKSTSGNAAGGLITASRQLSARARTRARLRTIHPATAVDDAAESRPSRRRRLVILFIQSPNNAFSRNDSAPTVHDPVLKQQRRWRCRIDVTGFMVTVRLMSSRACRGISSSTHMPAIPREGRDVRAAAGRFQCPMPNALATEEWPLRQMLLATSHFYPIQYACTTQ
jgi:hypothetical protein